MNDLVYSSNGYLVTNQDKISTISKVDVNSVQKLIRTYRQDLECFGKLEFSLQKIAKTNKKIYELNEQQATLLLTYMKNSESVRNAKKVLVFAFYQMKEKLKNLEQEQMQKLAFRQSLGYKSQLAQQKTNFKNQIKALKYDLNQTKDELDICKGALEVLKRRKDFSNEENLRLLQKELAKYGLVIFNELDFALWSENLTKNIIGETKRRLDDLINYNYQILKDKFNKRLNIKETKCYK
ncbi:phage regulatory protein [Campylobacter lari]|nr:phage regulatory protein [Campylobacter lari]